MRVGLFGGTFDPPHMGHLIVASDAFEALELDRLLFIPSAQPPHKQDQVTATAEQRVEMVRAAIAGDPRFALDDLEVRRRGTSYSVDTLRAIRERDPEAELFFLLGVDQMRALHTWREPDEVARLAHLAVMTRDGELPDPDTRFRHRTVHVTRVDISATEIRARLRTGRSVRYMVPEAVRGMVEKLYR